VPIPAKLIADVILPDLRAVTHRLWIGGSTRSATNLRSASLPSAETIETLPRRFRKTPEKKAA
jgi:hypothetical protein